MKRTHLSATTTIALLSMLNLFSCQEFEQENAPAGTALEAGAERHEPETAFPGENGIERTGTLFGKQITYKEINGKAVFEGDIILTPEQLGQNSNARTEAFTQIHSLWPNNTVPYTVDAGVSNEAPIQAAIAEIEAKTPVRFVRRRTLPNFPGTQLPVSSYVTFTYARGYYSSIGRTSGQQFIGMPVNATKGGLLHEIGHTLGLLHEHTRQDRNTSVKVNLNNVADASQSSFTILDNEDWDNKRYGAFDFGSIMMMDSYAYSKNGLPTMLTLRNGTFSVQRTQLSTGDANCITAMYSNIFAVTSTGIIAGDTTTGKNAPLATSHTGVDEVYALSNLMFISKGPTILRLRQKSGQGYGTSTGTAKVKGMTYYKGNIYALQDGIIWKMETANGLRQAFTPPYFSSATSLAYAFGLPYVVMGNTLYVVSYDGKQYYQIGTGYTGVTEMAGLKDWLYVLKPDGKLYRVGPTNGNITLHTTMTFAADAQITSNGKNLLIVSQGTLYSVDTAGAVKTISTGWNNVTDLSATSSEDL